VQQRLGASDQAEASFTKSESIYSALIERSPRVIPSFQQILTVHAALRRARGDDAGAGKLQSQAQTLGLLPSAGAPAPARSSSIRETRRAGDITIIEGTPIQLTDEDVQRIRSLAGAPISRMEVSHVDAAGAPLTMSVDACMKAPEVKAGLRRGSCAVFAKMRSGARGQAGGWQKVTDKDEYVLFGDASDMQPTRLMSIAGVEPLSDARVVAIHQLLRRRAVASPTTRLRSDIQPWRIATIVPVERGDYMVVLTSDDGSQRQTIRLRPVGDGWDVVEMREG